MTIGNERDDDLTAGAAWRNGGEPGGEPWRGHRASEAIGHHHPKRPSTLGTPRTARTPRTPAHLSTPSGARATVGIHCRTLRTP
jgi:hypothetical protein